MRGKFKIVEFPIMCGYRVHVEFCSDIWKSMKKYPPCEIVEPDGNTRALAIHTDNAFSFIFLPNNADAGSIAHEAWHVILRMMKFAGVEVDNEAVAYHLGYLVNEIDKFRRKR